MSLWMLCHNKKSLNIFYKRIFVLTVLNRSTLPFPDNVWFIYRDRISHRLVTGREVNVSAWPPRRNKSLHHVDVLSHNDFWTLTVLHQGPPVCSLANVHTVCSAGATIVHLPSGSVDLSVGLTVDACCVRHPDWALPDPIAAVCDDASQNLLWREDAAWAAWESYTSSRLALLSGM